MPTLEKRIPCILASVLVLAVVSDGAAQDSWTFALELEAGPVWASRNDVQIPNDEGGSRFSLVDLVGSGPWPAGRLYLSWRIEHRHSLRALVAPLSYTETGSFAEPVAFAGETYQPGLLTDATYQFNSWRLGYRYRFHDRERLKLWIGFTAKIRDARIQLRQEGVSSEDTDVGFVPLLHLAADWGFARRWRLLSDLDGLAGGPGRAFDVAVEVAYDLGDGWGVGGGYRTVEGGADVESVYTFAWFHAVVVSGTYRF